MALEDRFTINRTSHGSWLDWHIAEGDFNRDGHVDVMISRLMTPTFVAPTVALSNGDGSYRVESLPLGFQNPVATTGDFNGDGNLDVAMFDAGVYDWTIRNGVGQPPVLLLGTPTGQFVASDALANAVLTAPDNTYLGTFSDADLHIKKVTAGDIDRDGDLDLWVNSDGGDNISSHFMINNGDGTFQVDPDRIAFTTLHGTSSGDYWRHQAPLLTDVDGDGAPDLVLGQSRDNDPTHITQSSYIIYNDGSGSFPLQNRVMLPLPDFYHGYTSVGALDVGDVNADGIRDLVLSHTRNDDVSGPEAETPWEGRYLQILMGNGDGTFRDETAARLGDQSVTANPTGSNRINAPGSLTLTDFNGDGHLDIVMGQFWPPSDAAAPLVMVNDGIGRFSTFDTTYFTDGDPSYGSNPIVRDLNGDGRLDMFHVEFGTGESGILVFQTASGAVGTGPGGMDPASVGAPGFNEAYYLFQNADVAAAVAAGQVASGLQHYLDFGRSAGREAFAPHSIVRGGATSEAIALREGNEQAIAGSGEDTVYGFGGNDTLYGNVGLDVVSGGDGDDWIYGGQNAGAQSGGLFGVMAYRDGIETLDGEGGNDLIYGNHGSDVISGGAGNDTVFGGQEADTIDGGAGDDYLLGDLGDDRLTGGAGADRFHVKHGADTITDFSRAEGDTLSADGALASVTDSAAGVVVAFSDGSQVTLVGVASTSLTGDWLV